MRPSKKEPISSGDLFRARFDEIINMHDELVRLLNPASAIGLQHAPELLQVLRLAVRAVGVGRGRRRGIAARAAVADAGPQPPLFGKRTAKALASG